MQPGDGKATQTGWVCLALCMVASASCGRGQSIAGGALAVPTLEDLPALTNKTSLPVHGQRQPDNEVWVNYQDDTKSRLSVSAPVQDWNGTVNLAPGSNILVVYGVVPLGRSEYSANYTITCDPYPPSAPTVQAPEAVYVSGGGSTTITISGTKDADADAEINGQVVASAGSTSWTATVVVVAGNNTYTVTSVDEASNVSTPVTVTIFGSLLQTPILVFPNVNPNNDPSFISNEHPFLTNSNYQNFYGTKQADTELYVVVNGGTPQDLGFMNSASWNQNFTLPADGTYTIAYYVTQAGQPAHSGEAVVTVLLNTQIPQAPIITSPTFPLGDVGEASFTMTGSLPSSDSYLCVSSTPSGPCIVTSSYLGGTFNVAVPLIDGADGSGAGHPSGTNPIYISARDAYGNMSSETVESVYRISPPVVTNLLPVNNAVIAGSSLPVTLTATPYSGDANHATAAISEVRVCLDLTCLDAVAGGSGSYNVNPPFDLTGLQNGSTHTLSVTVSNSLTAPLQTVITEQLVFSDGSPIWVSLNDPNQVAQSPKMALDAAGNLHVVWSDFCGQAGAACLVANTNVTQPPDIFYSRRNASDGSWSPVALVSSTTNDGASTAPALAVDSNGDVHIVWTDDGTAGVKPSGPGLLHRMVGHSGWTLSAVDAVGAPTSGIDDVNPSLAADGAGDVHVAFTRKTSNSRYDIAYVRYLNGAWSSPLQVTADPNTGQADLPTVAAAAAGRAHVAWQECRTDSSAVNHCMTSIQHDIYLQEVVSTSALGFGPVLVSDADKALYGGDSLQPSLVVDANNLDWVVWSDTTTLGTHSAPSNIWLQTFAAGVKQANSYHIVSNDANTVGYAASQPTASLGSAQGGAAGIAVGWTQVTPSSAEIAARTALLSDGLSGLANSTTSYAATSPGDSQSADVLLNGAGDVFVVWQDDSTFGSANTAGVGQIFLQVELP